MKVQSYTIVHYGKDYLSYALRSVYHSVDRLNVFYTPNPSHGHHTNTSPPETKDELMSAAYAYDPDNKIKWYDVEFLTQEGQQRNLALEHCQDNGAELVVVVDCDEVWHRDQLELALSIVWESSFRNHLVNMIHFWRSFDWVCRDDGWPVRIIDLRAANRAVSYIPREVAQVCHFGYAVRDELMKYKWEIHGHKNELRKDWFEIWGKWPMPSLKMFAERVRFIERERAKMTNYTKPEQSVHPTNTNDFWVPEPFDKSELPELMKDHPFYNLEKIE